MKVLLIIGGILAALALLLLVQYRRAVRGGERVFLDIIQSLEPILHALERRIEPDSRLIAEAAADSLTRNELYGMLLYHKRLDLFPPEFHTWGAMTESDLVVWLLHPSELGCRPDEIELVARVPSDGDNSVVSRFYFVFRFRMHPPHWAAKKGWLAGVVGPHNTKAEPMPQSREVFSSFESFDSRSHEEHVRATHELLARKR